MTEVLKTPASDMEAERCVLGAIMLDNAAMDLVAVEIKPEDFYFGRNRVIYEAMVALHAGRKPLDAFSVVDRLKTTGMLDVAGGVVEVSGLTNVVPTAANAVYYAQHVSLKARLRGAQEVNRWATSYLFERHEESDAALEEFERRVFEATHKRLKSKAPEAIGDVLQETLKSLERSKRGHRDGVVTGFATLDARTNGLPKGEVTIVAARPSCGKSSFAMNVARNVAYGPFMHEPVKRVAYFTLEMPSQAVTTAMICSVARVDSMKLRNGSISREEEDAFLSAAERIHAGQVFLADADDLTAAAIRAHCRRLGAKQPLDLVVVDYLQLVNPEGGGWRAKQRHEEVAQISRALKALAAELKVPVLACAQLNRKSDDRPDGRPRLADLRESGSLEQDAALVILLHRPELYEEDPDKRALLANDATVIIAKNRYGPVGEIPFEFEKRWSLFEDIGPGASTGEPRRYTTQPKRDAAALAAGEHE